MDIICLDPDFSTTRSLIKERPAGLNELEPNPSRVGEGGLRTKGYYKISYPGKPLISIVTVVYNDAQYIEKAIQSVLNQPYDNVEYIIIDGTSTDGTADIIRKYQDYIDYWVSESDKGIFDAMNKAVEIAWGAWIYFLGADDILVNVLHKIVPYFKNECRIYYGDVYLPTKNKVYDGKFNLYKLMRKNINHQAIFYPRRVFDKYKYIVRYGRISDYEFNIKCWADKDFKFAYLPFLINIFNDTRFAYEEVEVINEKELSIFYNDKPELIRRYFYKAILWQNIYSSARRVLVMLLEMIRLKKILLKVLREKR